MKIRSWTFTMALRFIRTRRKARQNVISTLSILGLIFGSMMLISVISVMNGFQVQTLQDIIELRSYHLQIDHISDQDFESELSELRALDEVKSAVPFVDIFGIAKGYFRSNQGIQLRAIEAEGASADYAFWERLDFGIDEKVSEVPSVGKAFLGSELARSLGLRVGDVFQFMNLNSKDFDIREAENFTLLVDGIFESGYYDFDRNSAIISLATAQQYLETDAEVIVGIKLDDLNEAYGVRSQLQDEQDFSVASWEEYNRAIFNALRVEKGMIMVFIGLIFVVVGVNIYQALRRFVLEKTEEIAVLKALGADPSTVKSIFLFEGAIIGAIGSTVGTMLGVLIASNIRVVFGAFEAVVSFFQNLFNPESSGNFQVFSSDYFYINEVPSEIIPSEVILILLFCFSSAMIAAFLAAKGVAQIKPAQVLRYE